MQAEHDYRYETTDGGSGSTDDFDVAFREAGPGGLILCGAAWFQRADDDTAITPTA